MHAAESNRVATFAGGCFWCMEPAFEKLTGVKNVVAGYAGGTGPNPTYKDYARKRYVEAVQITYDPSRISYAELLNTFWKQIDPTDQDGQFVDRGKQYRSAIFYHTPTQKQEAEQSKQKLAQSHRFAKPIVTEIIPATNFYPAEEYHQDYAQKNPVRYWWYRRGSGRDQFIKTNWSTPKNHTSSDHQSKVGTLTQLQRSVTQEGGTEPPFKNAYWDNTKPGIYVDIVSGEPLFSSTDKFKSGTGWPSFTKPINPDAVVLKKQWSLFGTRIEVKSKKGNSHLGDLFYDGPAPAGTRYCINSAALRFIPVADLQKEGYGTYLPLFSQAESA